MMFEKVLHMHGSKRALILGTTALAFMVIAQVGFADTNRCNEALVPQPEECRRGNADIVVTMPTGENAELIDRGATGGFADQGFSISIDGETVAGAVAPVDPRRQADRSAASANIDVRYDGLDLRRNLNVSTTDLRAGFRAGEEIRFRTSSNYPAFIKRAEVRIIDRAARGRPIVAVLPAQANGSIGWANAHGWLC
jgi:hypothetical protein